MNDGIERKGRKMARFQIMGQSNPDKGWHILNGGNIHDTLCGVQFDMRGRVYNGDHMWDRLERICPDCLEQYEALSAPALSDQEPTL